MIGGADLERGTVTAGGRGYYLMGPAVCLQVNKDIRCHWDNPENESDTISQDV